MKAVLKPDFEQLEQYILGALEGKSRMSVEKLLREERDWAETHLELKEALLLRGGTDTAPAALRAEIIDWVKNESQNFRSVLIAVMKEKTIIAATGTSRQEISPGPLTFTCDFGDNTATVNMVPLKKKDTFSLAIGLHDKDGISALLAVDGVEQEKIGDLGLQDVFQTHLQTPCSADIAFLKKNKIVFSLNLRLRNS